MSIDLLDVQNLDRQSLDFVWANLREADRIEATLQGMTDATYPTILDYQHKFTATYDGVPLCCYGALETEGCFWIFFIATGEIRKHMKLLTACARGLIDHLRRLMFGKRCLVEVWEGHAASRHWLARLGFEEMGAKMNNGARFLILEKRGN